MASLSRSVSSPKAAGAAPYKRIQIEASVERFERLLQCEKLIPLDALKPVARKALKSVYRNGRGRVRAAMDRTMINDAINLLFITVAYGGRAPPDGVLAWPLMTAVLFELQPLVISGRL